jgi:hypothetical protein
MPVDYVTECVRIASRRPGPTTAEELIARDRARGLNAGGLVRSAPPRKSENGAGVRLFASEGNS